jgi:hypothetical protein
MASMNPKNIMKVKIIMVTYVTLEEMVNNFIANYTGDGTILGKSDAQNNLPIQTRD